FLLLAELWQQAARLLDVGDAEALESALRALLLAGEVVVEHERVYRTELWEMECRLGQALGARASAPAAELFEEPHRPDVELADALFEAAGDCHVLLVGDTDQLPPIGPGSALADLVASEVVPRVHLTAIYRQAARSLIIQSARRINAGELPFLSFDEARAALG